MATWGDTAGSFGRSNVGAGYSINPSDIADPQSVVHPGWRYGIIANVSPEELPAEAALSAVDLEVGLNNALVRSPGLSVVESALTHSVKYMFPHASLDFSTELVMFDPPYIGIKKNGATAWYSVGLAASDRGWNAVNVAGTLLFSNGVAQTFIRQPNTTTITAVTGVIADAFATAFGRVFAGSVTNDSGLQGMLVTWNGSSGDVTDWTGADSGGQLLISNQLDADRIMAMVPIGLSILAIVTRKAVWFGYETQQANGPASFVLRYPGMGCVARYTTVSTPNGVMYLSDQGVVLAGINSVDVLSAAINPLLLPLDTVNIDKYRAVYDSRLSRYILLTPSGCWFYQMAIGPMGDQSAIPARWIFRSFMADSIVIFTEQSGDVFWNDITGSWMSQAQSWAETVQSQSNSPAVLYVGSDAFAGIGREASDVDTYLGTAMKPSWVTPQGNKNLSDQLETIGFEIEFSTLAPASMQLTLPDTNGNFTIQRTVTLPNTAGVRTVGIFSAQSVGKGTSICISNISLNAQVFSIRHILDSAGPATVELAST